MAVGGCRLAGKGQSAFVAVIVWLLLRSTWVSEAATCAPDVQQNLTEASSADVFSAGFPVLRLQGDSVYVRAQLKAEIEVTEGGGCYAQVGDAVYFSKGLDFPAHSCEVELPGWEVLKDQASHVTVSAYGVSFQDGCGATTNVTTTAEVPLPDDLDDLELDEDDEEEVFFEVSSRFVVLATPSVFLSENTVQVNLTVQSSAIETLGLPKALECIFDLAAGQAALKRTLDDAGLAREWRVQAEVVEGDADLSADTAFVACDELMLPEGRFLVDLIAPGSLYTFNNDAAPVEVVSDLGIFTTTPPPASQAPLEVAISEEDYEHISRSVVRVSQDLLYAFTNGSAGSPVVMTQATFASPGLLQEDNETNASSLDSDGYEEPEEVPEEVDPEILFPPPAKERRNYTTVERIELLGAFPVPCTQCFCMLDGTAMEPPIVAIPSTGGVATSATCEFFDWVPTPTQEHVIEVALMSSPGVWTSLASVNLLLDPEVCIYDPLIVHNVQPRIVFTGFMQRLTLYGNFSSSVNYSAAWRSCPASLGECQHRAATAVECILQACYVSGPAVLEVFGSADITSQILADYDMYLWPYLVPVPAEGSVITPEAPFLDVELQSSLYESTTGLNISSTDLLPVRCVSETRDFSFTFTSEPFGIRCNVPVDPEAEDTNLSISVFIGDFPSPTNFPGEPENRTSFLLPVFGRGSPRILDVRPLVAIRGTAVLVIGTGLVEGLLCEFGAYIAAAFYISQEELECPLPSAGFGSVGVDMAPLRLLWADARPTAVHASNFTVQLRDRPVFETFYPQVGTAGVAMELTILGQNFPEGVSFRNRSAVECILGPVRWKTDPVWTPAVRVSDTEVRCNVTHSLRAEVSVGVAFSGYIAGILPNIMSWMPTDDLDVWYPDDFGLTPIGNPILEAIGDTPVYEDPQEIVPDHIAHGDDFEDYYTPHEVLTEEIEFPDKQALIISSIRPQAIPLITGGTNFTINFDFDIGEALACRLWPGGTELITERAGPRSVACASEVLTSGTKIVEVSYVDGGLQWEPSTTEVQVYFETVVTSVIPSELYPTQAWSLNVSAASWPDASIMAGVAMCRFGGADAGRGVDVPGTLTDSVVVCNLTAEDIEVLGPGDHMLEVMPNGVHSTDSDPRVMVRVHPLLPSVESLTIDDDILSLGWEMQNSRQLVLLEKDEIINLIENFTLTMDADRLTAGTRLHVHGTTLPADAECFFRPASRGYTSWVSTPAEVTDSTSLSCWLPMSVVLSEGVVWRLGTAGQVIDVDAMRHIEVSLSEYPDAVVATAVIDEMVYGAFRGLHLQALPDTVTVPEKSPDVPDGRDETMAVHPSAPDVAEEVPTMPSAEQPDSALAEHPPSFPSWSFPVLRGPWYLPNNDSIATTPVIPGDRLLFQTNASQLAELRELEISIQCRVGPEVGPYTLEENGWISCKIPRMAPGRYTAAIVYRKELENHHIHIIVGDFPQDPIRFPGPLTLHGPDPEDFASDDVNESEVEMFDGDARSEVPPHPLVPHDTRNSMDIEDFYSKVRHLSCLQGHSAISISVLSLEAPRPTVELFFSGESEDDEEKPLENPVYASFRSMSPARGPMVGGTTVFASVYIPSLEAPWQYWCVFGFQTVIIRPASQEQTAGWMDVQCEVPRQASPLVVPFWISTTPNVSHIPVPEDAVIFEYTAVPSVTEVHPDVVLHHFTRKQYVTISIEAVLGAAAQAHIEADAARRLLSLPRLQHELEGAFVTLQGRVSGRFLCIESGNESAQVSAAEGGSIGFTSSNASDDLSQAYEMESDMEMDSNSSDLVLDLEVYACTTPTAFEVVAGDRGLVTFRSMADRLYLVAQMDGQLMLSRRPSPQGLFRVNELGEGEVSLYQPALKRHIFVDAEAAGASSRSEPHATGERLLVDFVQDTHRREPTLAASMSDGSPRRLQGARPAPLSEGLRGPVFCRHNGEVDEAEEVWEYGRLVAVRCPLSEDAGDVFASPDARTAAIITNRTDCLPRWCTFDVNTWKMAIGADLAPSQEAANRPLEEDAPLYFDQGVPITPARLLSTASVTRAPESASIERPENGIDYDRERRIEISFNGPDGDYVAAPSSTVQAAQFRLPYAIEPLYAWTDGGSRIFLRGINWIPGQDMDYYLIFNFTSDSIQRQIDMSRRGMFSGMLPVLCEQHGHEDAVCIVPPAPENMELQARLSLAVKLQEEWYEYDLANSWVDMGRAGDPQVRSVPAPVFTYLPVPTVESIFPDEAAHLGGTLLEVHGGPFDNRVPHWCAWFAATGHEEALLPGQRIARVAVFVNSTTVLCETPLTWGPAQVTLSLSMDANLTLLARGHAAADLYEPLDDVGEGPGQRPCLPKQVWCERAEVELVTEPRPALATTLVTTALELAYLEGDSSEQEVEMAADGSTSRTSFRRRVVPRWQRVDSDHLPGAGIFLEAVGEHIVHNNISEDRGLLLRGRGFASLAPASCWSSHEPDMLFDLTVLTDGLALCHLPPGPFDYWGYIEVRVVTGAGVWTDGVNISVEAAPAVYSLGQMVAYDVGLHHMQIVGEHLPVKGLWCRFGELHTRALVDEFSNQTRATCRVPPHEPGMTTMRIVSIPHRMEFPSNDFVYRPQVRLLNVLPRAYLPYTATSRHQPQMVTIEGHNFIPQDNCTVFFGEHPSPRTRVHSTTMLQAVVPEITSNKTVKIHLYCTPDHLQADGQDILEFEFVSLPRVSSVKPNSLVLSSPRWVSLRGESFEDTPYKTCRVGNLLLQGHNVRFRNSRWVQCRLPQMRDVLEDLDMSYSNDGIFFSEERILLSIEQRFVVTSVEPTVIPASTVVPIKLYGERFTSDVVCILQEHIKLRPIEQSSQEITCEMPSIFSEVGSKISILVLFSDEQMAPVDQRMFYLEVEPAPTFNASTVFDSVPEPVPEPPGIMNLSEWNSGGGPLFVDTVPLDVPGFGNETVRISLPPQVVLPSCVDNATEACFGVYDEHGEHPLPNCSHYARLGLCGTHPQRDLCCQWSCEMCPGLELAEDLACLVDGWSLQPSTRIRERDMLTWECLLPALTSGSHTLELVLLSGLYRTAYPRSSVPHDCSQVTCGALADDHPELVAASATVHSWGGVGVPRPDFREALPPFTPVIGGVTASLVKECRFGWGWLWEGMGCYDELAMLELPDLNETEQEDLPGHPDWYVVALRNGNDYRRMWFHEWSDETTVPPEFVIRNAIRRVAPPEEVQWRSRLSRHCTNDQPLQIEESPDDSGSWNESDGWESAWDAEALQDDDLMDIGRNLEEVQSPILLSLAPPRGFRVGGTIITFESEHLVWERELQCRFGAVIFDAMDPAETGSEKIQCRAPPCRFAFFERGIVPIGVEECFGFVPVQMSFDGINFFGDLVYEYVRMPAVLAVSPFPASSWNQDLLVTIHGEHFSTPYWCRWLDMPPTRAVDISPDQMKCVAPALPDDRRPIDADFLQGYVEISPNLLDWTRDRFQYLWYQEPIVRSVEPNITFHSYAPEGDFILTGSHFRLLRTELVNCHWLYDVNYPAEVTRGVLLSPTVMRCSPTAAPAEPDELDDDDEEYEHLQQPPGAVLEVSMTTWVQSISGYTVPTESRMQLVSSDGSPVVPQECMLTGGCLVTLRGNHLWPDNDDWSLFVAVGESLQEAWRGEDNDPNVAYFRLPPLPHMTQVPLNQPMWLTRNLQDRTPDNEFFITYQAIPWGRYYRPELHDGVTRPCPPGYYCPGAGANQTTWVASGEAPLPCPPGTFQNASGQFGCVACPEGVQCPRPAMIEPEPCQEGYICWGATNYDANQAICPAGVVCLRPPYGKTPTSSTRRLERDEPGQTREVTFEVEATPHAGRRLRLAAMPSSVEVLPCPAGYFCPPGSIAQQNGDGTITIESAVPCTEEGILCSEGSFIALATDATAPPGYYISDDKSTLIQCPQGTYCPGGTDATGPILCPPGQYQVSAGAPECATCTAGTICPGFGLQAPEPCPEGQVCSHPGRLMPSYLCPSGSWCPSGLFTMNTQGNISGAPIICPEGVYCLPGTVSLEVNDLSTTNARNCVEGTFCGANSTSAAGTSNCPRRWYCPRGVSIPQPSPPGHYVSEPGQVYPSKCRPGTYAPYWLMQECLPCPAGMQCELDGTITPIACPAGTYRELTPADQDPSDNVLCIACPQGRWSPDGGLTSVLSCLDCAERYACEIEGTTIFATQEQPCNASSGPTDICYENSQGVDCPQGYSCPVATAGFTMYDLPCEPGYWCKVRTIPSESRNLLCPAGYYCKQNSGESGGSGRKAFKCPLNHFCPDGTAAIDVRSPIDNQWVTQLYNVQSQWVSGTGLPDASGVKYDNHVLLVNEETGAMCRQCDHEAMGPGNFDVALCGRCGERLVPDEEDEIMPSPFICAPDVQNPALPVWQGPVDLQDCFVEVEAWNVLECPVGTASSLQSTDAEDCMQVGMRIAVVDIYRCYPARAPLCRGAVLNYPPDFQCGSNLALCNATSNLEVIRADDTKKNSFLWETPLNDQPDQLVYFLGYDPNLDPELDLDRSQTFYNITLKTMEIAILIFDFTNMNPTTYLNAGGQGHLDIHIHSSWIPTDNQDMMERGHTLPAFFSREWNRKMNVEFQMRILALQDLEFSVQLDLRHGAHIANLDTLNETLDIATYRPTFAQEGTNNFFVAVISKEFLLEGDYELPYNMPPGIAGARGEPELIIDMRNTSGMANEPETVTYSGAEAVSELQQAGTAFWGSTSEETVALPWLPFFSNCDGFDSHIIIWDLFEFPGGLDGKSTRAVRDGCERPEEIKTVETLGFSFSTLEPSFDPVADNCEFIINCRFEESLNPQEVSADAVWWSIEEEVDLFYITRDPVSAEDYLLQDEFFADMQGRDSLISVALENAARKAGQRIPRKVLFDMQYYQETVERKRMVSVLLSGSEFDDDRTNDNYQLMLIFGASSWQDLMNGFQLPYIVYGILYCIIGLGAVAFTVGGWLVIRLRSKVTTIPPWRFAECYEFLLWWPMEGVAIASVPIIVVTFIVKISYLPEVNLIGSIPCTYAGWNNNLLDDGEMTRCRLGRSGVCFMLTGIFTMYSASRMIIPRLREVEEQFLLQQPAQLLHREGLHLPVEQKSLIRNVPVRWKRGHLLFMSFLLMVPLMILWEFTYSDFFEAEPVYFIIGFNFGMIPVEAALSRAVREELIQVPLSTSCTVVLFIGTLGADDFADFCEGFFIELVIGVMDRLLLGHLFEWTGNTVKRVTNFFRTRSWFLSCLVGNLNHRAGGVLLRKVFMATSQKTSGAEAEEEEEVEGTPIEEAMEEIIGCGTTCMSTIVAPYVILLIMFFGEETQIADGYGIREIDLVCYLLFGIMIAPFQVLMDIIMNHATEIGQGVKVYDYMLYAKWKWRNRLVRWLFDDPRMDQSIAEPLQSINHLCFSPQFYFIACYYTWGMLMVMIAITSMTRHEMNPFDDPMFFFVLGQMFVCNTLADKIIRTMIFVILWKPKDNTVARAFSRSITWSMRRREANASQERFRDWFVKKHAVYLVDQLGAIFTPRSREKYRGALSQLYQQLLELQPTHLYATPGPAFPEPKALQELPPILRAELMEEDDSSDSGEGEEEREERRQRAIINAQEQQAKLGLPPIPAMHGSSLPQLPALPSPHFGNQALPSPPSMPPPSMPPPALPAATAAACAIQDSPGGPLVLSDLPAVEPCPIDQERRGMKTKAEMAALPWCLKMPDGSLPLKHEVKDLPPTPGPLAGYIGKAWLATVRRRISMERFCRKVAKEMPCDTTCHSCGAREDDPFGGLDIELWDGQPLTLSVQEDKDLEEMVKQYEDFHGVPMYPYDELSWKTWLQRRDMFVTLCHRCIRKRIADRAPNWHRLVQDITVGEGDGSSSSSSVGKPSPGRSQGPSPGTSPTARGRGRSGSAESDTEGQLSPSNFDQALSPASAGQNRLLDPRFMESARSVSTSPTPKHRNLAASETPVVAGATRAQIMYWARLARRRVRARHMYDNVPEAWS